MYLCIFIGIYINNIDKYLSRYKHHKILKTVFFLRYILHNLNCIIEIKNFIPLKLLFKHSFNKIN